MSYCWLLQQGRLVFYSFCLPLLSQQHVLLYIESSRQALPRVCETRLMQIATQSTIKFVRCGNFCVTHGNTKQSNARMNTVK
jgi:hypothetical protein